MHNQINEKERLQRLIDKKETDYANSIYLNPVKEYIDPKINIKELIKEMVNFELKKLTND